jgi:hypothetical protein
VNGAAQVPESVLTSASVDEMAEQLVRCGHFRRRVLPCRGELCRQTCVLRYIW